MEHYGCAGVGNDVAVDNASMGEDGDIAVVVVEEALAHDGFVEEADLRCVVVFDAEASGETVVDV